MKIFTRILVAYDGSAAAERAFDHAIDLAARYEARLDVAAVIDAPEFTGREELPGWLEARRSRHAGQFQALRKRAARSNVIPLCDTLVGEPSGQIVRRAAELQSDLIVIGHRDLGTVQRWLAGSVARAVLDDTRCAVLVVR